MPLGEQLFAKLASQNPLVAVPAYDKSAHAGRGDRAPEALWRAERPSWDVVILEGWCVGFRPIGKDEVQRRWKESIAQEKGTLRKYRLQDLEWLDEQLERYQGLWGKLRALVQVYVLHVLDFFFKADSDLFRDAQDLEYVYDWRIQQEHDLIKLKGTGMSDEQVREFVDSCMFLPLPPDPILISI